MKPIDQLPTKISYEVIPYTGKLTPGMKICTKVGANYYEQMIRESRFTESSKYRDSRGRLKTVWFNETIKEYRSYKRSMAILRDEGKIFVKKP